MAMVWNGVWDVHIETGLISQRTEDGVFKVLDVTAKLVLILREELGVTGSWEVEDLSNHAGDAGLSAFYGQGRSLEEVSR